MKTVAQINVNPDAVSSRGYLKEDFRLFHINNIETSAIPPHYHEFHKMIFLVKGNLSYAVEGHTYTLMPGDILLIPAEEIHQPIISDEVSYDRYVLWINKEYLEGLGFEKCFENNIRINNYNHSLFDELLKKLEEASASDVCGNELLKTAAFYEMIVHLTRFQSELSQISNEYSDPLIDEVLLYINENLAGDLRAEKLAGEFYLSKSRLLHLFKEVTGMSLHKYIQQKRLILSMSLLSQGISATEAASLCGFKDYSTFFRAFSKENGSSPKNFI